ncbi:MAM and LDL-receptor class A domain-containing protein 1-like isoform X3 [Branchiostoma floridae x Branchiostoma japonicum]
MGHMSFKSNNRPINMMSPPRGFQQLVIFIQLLQFTTGQSIEHPLPCDFEDEKPCFWAQMRDDDFDWTRQSGPSGFRTGPQTDHTYGNATGHYMFIETSAPRQLDDVARLIGPVITPSATEQCKMVIHYHMDGSTIGLLAVYKRQYSDNSESLLWSDFVDYNDVWQQRETVLTGPQPFQVIIEGLRGTGNYGDIAVDDITFSPGCFKEDEGSLRMVYASNSFYEGRLEIFHNSSWGTICDTGWTQASSRTACRQLGYMEANPATAALPGSGSAPIVLSNVACSGTENSLTDCTNNGWGNAGSCTHANDVVVRCSGYRKECQYNEFTCANEDCIPSGLDCDFTSNCRDNSDEASCSLFPGRCDFQYGLCDWIQPKNDDFDWNRVRGRETAINIQDHNGDQDGFLLYMDAALPREQDDKTRLILPQSFKPTNNGNCVIRFYHYMSGRDVGRLTLYISDINGKTQLWEGSMPAATWEREAVELQSNVPFQVLFEGTVGTSHLGHIALDDISLTTGCQFEDSACSLTGPTFTCTSGECVSKEHLCDFNHNCVDGSDEDDCNYDPGRCDFETDLCNWNQSDQDNFDFQRGQGSTDTSYTGPQTDHTKGNARGHYVFIDSSGHQSNHKARLVSYDLPAADTCKFRLYYHMFGSGVGSLIVSKRDLASGSVQELWRTTGDQGFQWLFASVNVGGPNKYQVLIEATVVGHEQGDIAIDDLSFTNDCYSEEQSSTDSPQTSPAPTVTLQWTGQNKPWLVPVIAGVVCASVVVLILVGLGVYLYRRKHKRLNDAEPIIYQNQSNPRTQHSAQESMEMEQQMHPSSPPPPYSEAQTTYSDRYPTKGMMTSDRVSTPGSRPETPLTNVHVH